MKSHLSISTDKSLNDATKILEKQKQTKLKSIKGYEIIRLNQGRN